ncbi:hypothetical protein GCM10020367_38330 [Streptomyces sannanensis]|uniref:Uncharacterized protein n=1 Tax=Streptomyces sannanensis TaxID=285536 RepID=A0ABP6SEE6_9ACTN
MRQKITPIVNRYVISAQEDGPVVVFAEQKRFKLKEEVTHWTGEDRRTLCRFKARQIDLGAVYDVTGADGEPLGSFKKDAKASLLRSTRYLTPDGRPPATGTERSLGTAVARRVLEVADALPIPVPVPYVYHFDFARKDVPVMSVERKRGILDRYRISVQGSTLDRRLALAMAVALYALQAR